MILDLRNTNYKVNVPISQSSILLNLSSLEYGSLERRYRGSFLPSLSSVVGVLPLNEKFFNTVLLKSSGTTEIT